MGKIAEPRAGVGRRRACPLIATVAFMACVLISWAWMRDAEASERGWRAGGNEPSWSLLRIGEQMTLETDFGATQVNFAVPPPKPVDDKTVSYTTVIDGEVLLIIVKTEVCVDTMTGMPRPENVAVTFGEKGLTGCGGDPAALLQGREWVVEVLDGQPTLEKPRITLTFDALGRISGLASCNQYGADYTITGEGLSIGKGMTTMMACDEPIMEQEQFFLELLQRVSGFSIGAEGALMLHTADNRTIKALRP